MENQDEKIYTQQDLDDLKTQMQSQIDDLEKYKPIEPSEEEIALQEREAAIWEKEVALTLKSEELDVFADFINVSVNDTEALNNQISKLKDIIKQMNLTNTYQPTDHKTTDEYSIAKKNKDVRSMLNAKLNK